MAAVGVRSTARETEMVCIVAETRLAPSEHGKLDQAIRAALKRHEITVDRVLLLAPKSLPKTTSGKIQRLAIARMLEKDKIASISGGS